PPRDRPPDRSDLLFANQPAGGAAAGAGAPPPPHMTVGFIVDRIGKNVPRMMLTIPPTTETCSLIPAASLPPQAALRSTGELSSKMPIRLRWNASFTDADGTPGPALRWMFVLKQPPAAAAIADARRMRFMVSLTSHPRRTRC